MIVLELAGPPRGKGRPRSAVVKGKDGQTRVRVFSDPKTVSYETQLAHIATQAMQGRSLIDGAVRLVMTVSFPVPASWSKKKRNAALSGKIQPLTKPDVDNTLKLTDALNQLVWRDDSQVVDAHVVKRYSDRPGLRIEITDLSSLRQLLSEEP